MQSGSSISRATLVHTSGKWQLRIPPKRIEFYGEERVRDFLKQYPSHFRKTYLQCPRNGDIIE